MKPENRLHCWNSSQSPLNTLLRPSERHRLLENPFQECHLPRVSTSEMPGPPCSRQTMIWHLWPNSTGTLAMNSQLPITFSKLFHRICQFLPDINGPFHVSRQDRIWVPDPFISNGKEEETHDVTVPNFYMRVYPNGTIRYDLRWVRSALLVPNFNKINSSFDKRCESHTNADLIRNEKVSFFWADWSYNFNEFTLCLMYGRNAFPRPPSWLPKPTIQEVGISLFEILEKSGLVKTPSWWCFLIPERIQTSMTYFCDWGLVVFVCSGVFFFCFLPWKTYSNDAINHINV